MRGDLEPRLRHHFGSERFRPRPGWELEVARAARRSEAGAGRGPQTRAAGWRPRLLAGGALALVALLALITALPAAAGPEIPAWVAGLRSAVRIDSAAGGRASSWGVTMEVVGAYLDDQRTIVFLRRSDSSGAALPNAYLVAAGRRYDMTQAVTDDDGYAAVKFPPLPAAWSAPVPVTLHLADGPVLPPHFWTLTFSIGPRAPETRELPAPGRAGEMALAFTSVSVGGGTLAYGFTETGVPYDTVLGPVHTSTGPNGIQSSIRGPIAVHVQAFDRAGRPLRWLDLQITPAGGDSVTWSEVSLLTGPGPYRIVITAPSGATLERVVSG